MAKEKFYSSYENQEIENILVQSDTKPFVLYYDQSNKLYRFFPTEEKKAIWVAAYEAGEMTEEIAEYEFTISFTAPAPYTINVNSLKDNQYVLYGSTGTNLEFSFQTVDGNGASVNESVDAYYTFKSPSGTTSVSNVYNAGTNVKLNIDGYLTLGTNVITILLRGRSTGVTKTAVVTYYVVQLDVTSTFDIARSITPNTNFGVTYTVIGQADKTVTFYIDGVITATAAVSSLEASATRTQIFNNASGNYAPGKHTLQIQASMMAGDSTFYSKLLYYEFVITGTPQTQILIKEVFPSTKSIIIGALPGLTGEQYVTSTFNWAYYSSDSLQQTATIQWRLYTEAGVETTLATRNADVVEAETDKAPDPLSFMPTEYGDYELQALIGSQIIETYTISVIKNTSGIIEATEGLTMKLTGLGRSNDEPAETLTSWANRGYSATFFNQQWNGTSGWNSDALWLNNGATCRINNKPFCKEIAPQSNNGVCFEIDFETFNVDDENAEVVRIGGTTGPSFVITANKAVLTSNIGAKMEARFKSDERVKLAFIVCPNSYEATAYPQMMFVQNNGVLSQGANYDIHDTFNIGSSADASSNEGMINIGNSQGKCGIKIYYIRTYNAAINMYEELNNYYIDSINNLQQLVIKNDIYTTGTRQIDVDKLESLVTTVKITGPVNILIDTQSKATISGGLEVTCPSNPNVNISCANAQFSNAGQSTLGLPVPSMHVKLDKNGNVCYDRDGKILVKNRWAFRTGNVPEKKFRLQANYMESSGCHNGAFFRMFNEVAPKVSINNEYVLRTPAENYAMTQYPAAMRAKHGEDPRGKNWEFPYTMHMTPDSIPAVVVWRKTEDDPYNFLGQYVIMEEKKSNFTNCMRSIYDTVDQDGNPDPFKFSSSGGTRLWDNTDCRQFEILRSSEDLTLFLTDNDWSKETRELAFEMEYPDPDDVQAEYDAGESEKSVDDYWNEFRTEFVHPVCVTRNNQAAFNQLYITKFHRWHWAAYYCLMLRNCCVDSVVRNMELTTYDMEKWIPKWWDNDMECGLQQSGECNIEPCSDRTTIVPGTTDAYAFAGRYASGRSSWLWDALENCYQFRQDVKLMDEALYNAGWTYNKMTETQDNVYIDAWSQSLYNESGVVKYIDYDHLLNLQGDRTSHRHWFLRTSYDYFDAINVCGEYKSKIIYMRTLGVHTGNQMKFKAGATSYFGWGTTQEIRETGIHALKGENFTIDVSIGSSEIQYNDPIQIYAANKLEEVDLSDIARYLYGELQFDKTYDTVTGSLLKKLVIGISKTNMHAGIFNTYTGIASAISGLETMPRLEEFNMQGLYYVQNINFEGMSALKKMYAAGSTLSTFNPSEGVQLSYVELPTTVTSMTMEGCSLTRDGNCCITWYNTLTRLDASSGLMIPYDVQETTVPATLKYLHFAAQGRDIGTQKLIVDWIRAQAAVNSPSAFEQCQLYYTSVYWTGLDVADLLNIAKIPKGQRTITGYIKCSNEFTTEQMNLLTDAFGENIFNISNNLCIDCESTNVIVSAYGTNTSVTAADGTINILQGTNAQLQAVGFPLITTGSSYKWYVKNSSGQFVSGTPNLPYISFGLNGANNIHYTTGAVTTTENSAPTRSFDIYVEKMSGSAAVGSGTAKIRVVSRVYPTDASIQLIQSQSEVEVVEGAYQIKSLGHYLFETVHYPVGYTGRLAETNGGVWNVEGFDSSYVAQCTQDYLNGKTGFEQYCLQVNNMPPDEYNMTMNYQSNWRNGLTITATPLEICLVTVIFNALTDSLISGNLPMFKAIEAAGLAHAEPHSYNSFELKQRAGTLNFRNLLIEAGVDVTSFTNVNNDGKNVLSYMKNIENLNFDDCTALKGNIDVRKCKYMRQLLLMHTDTTDVSIAADQPLTRFEMGHPTQLILNNHIGLSLANCDASSGYVSRTRSEYNPLGLFTCNGFPSNAPVHYGTDDASMLNGIVAEDFTIDDVHAIDTIEINMPGGTTGALRLLTAIEECLESPQRLVVDRLDASNYNLTGEYGKAVYNLQTETWSYETDGTSRDKKFDEYSTPIYGELTFNAKTISGYATLADGNDINARKSVARILTPNEVRAILELNDLKADTYASQMGYNSAALALVDLPAITEGRTKMSKIVGGREVNRIAVTNNDGAISLSCADLNVIDTGGDPMDAVGIVEVRASRDLEVSPLRIGVRMVRCSNPTS